MMINNFNVYILILIYKLIYKLKDDFKYSL
jgi:hypothetical protein